MWTWIKARLAEKSTYTGLGVIVLTLLSAFGVTDPEMQGHVKTVLEAIGGLVGAVLVAKNTTPAA